MPINANEKKGNALFEILVAAPTLALPLSKYGGGERKVSLTQQTFSTRQPHERWSDTTLGVLLRILLFTGLFQIPLTNPSLKKSSNYGKSLDTSSLGNLINARLYSLEARNQQRELERIALHSKYVLPPRSQLKRDTSHPADTQISERIKQHRILVEQMKKSIEEQNRQKFQQEMETLRKSLANLTKPRCNGYNLMDRFFPWWLNACCLAARFQQKMINWNEKLKKDARHVPYLYSMI